MFSNGSAKQYPNLANYLTQLSRRPSRTPLAVEGRVAYYGLLILAFGLLLAGAPGWTVVAAFGGVLFLAVSLSIVQTAKNSSGASNFPRLQAKEAGKVMRECLDKRRLHRDLDPASLTLLEECARNWDRVHQAFSLPFWKRDDLAAHYLSARDLALQAADESMDQVIVLYRSYLPDRVTNRQALDYVDEALENYVFGSPKQTTFPPPAFETARQVAERLRSISDEADVIGKEGALEAGMPTKTTATSALDATLGELRGIREAEEELRQNLTG